MHWLAVVFAVLAIVCFGVVATEQGHPRYRTLIMLGLISVVLMYAAQTIIAAPNGRWTVH